jgi:hypothetical protein
MASVQFDSISKEFSGTDLGDARLEKRVLKIADTLAAMPDESFPTLTSNDSELEALYRFLNNDKVEADLVLAPHYRETVRRSALEKIVVVIHDNVRGSGGSKQGASTRSKASTRTRRWCRRSKRARRSEYSVSFRSFVRGLLSRIRTSSPSDTRGFASSSGGSSWSTWLVGA